jgi:hypothetical protein
MTADAQRRRGSTQTRQLQADEQRKLNDSGVEGQTRVTLQQNQRNFLKACLRDARGTSAALLGRDVSVG